MIDETQDLRFDWYLIRKIIAHMERHRDEPLPDIYVKDMMIPRKRWMQVTICFDMDAIEDEDRAADTQGGRKLWIFPQG